MGSRGDNYAECFWPRCDCILVCMGLLITYYIVSGSLVYY